MTAFMAAAAFFGGMMVTLLSGALGVWALCRWFRADETRGLAVMASMLRSFFSRSDYESVLVPDGAGVRVVPIEHVARAFENVELSRHRPAALTRSDPPPPMPRH